MNNKIITIIVAVLSVIGIGLFIMVFGADEGTAEETSRVSNLVTYSLFLLGITAAVTILGSLFSLFKNPAALKKALMGLVALGVVFAISYIFSNSDQVLDATGVVKAEAGSQVSKLTSTGIFFSGGLMLVAGAFFVWDLLKGLVKS